MKILSCKNFTKQFRNALLITACYGVLLTSCSQNAQRDAICDRANRWNLASSSVAEISSSIATTSPGRLQDVFTEVVATLSIMSEVAPTSIKPSIEKLRDTYIALATALEDLGWQGALIEKDSAATSAAVRLASDELNRAESDLVEYIDVECSVLIKSPADQFLSTGTTLPDPVIQDDSKELPAVGFDNDVSVLKAFGYVVAERFDVAITETQAICVGQSLVDNAVYDDSKLDNTYYDLLQIIFDECLVNIDINKFLES